MNQMVFALKYETRGSIRLTSPTRPECLSNIPPLIPPRRKKVTLVSRVRVKEKGDITHLETPAATSSFCSTLGASGSVSELTTSTTAPTVSCRTRNGSSSASSTSFSSPCNRSLESKPLSPSFEREHRSLHTRHSSLALGATISESGASTTRTSRSLAN